MRRKILTIICLILLPSCTPSVTFFPHEPLIGDVVDFPPYKGEVQVLTEFPINPFSYDKVGMLTMGIRYNTDASESLLDYIKGAAAERGGNAIIVKHKKFAAPIGEWESFKQNLASEFGSGGYGQEAFDTEVYAIRLTNRTYIKKKTTIKKMITEQIDAIKDAFCCDESTDKH